MKVINKVEDRVFGQWLEGFVRRVIIKSKIKCKEVVITAFRDCIISISVDGEKERYKIEIVNPRACETDENGMVCGAMNPYTLLEKVGEYKYLGTKKGCFKVSWINRLEDHYEEETIEGLALGILEMEGIDTSDAQYCGCVDSMMIVNIRDIDYLINVNKFPQILVDDMTGFPMTYSMGTIIYSEDVDMKRVVDSGIREISIPLKKCS